MRFSGVLVWEKTRTFDAFVRRAAILLLLCVLCSMRVRTGQIVEERATQTDALVGSLISGLADIPVPLFVND